MVNNDDDVTLVTYLIVNNYNNSTCYDTQKWYTMNGDAVDSSNDDNDDIPTIQPVFADDVTDDDDDDVTVN